MLWLCVTWSEREWEWQYDIEVENIWSYRFFPFNSFDIRPVEPLSHLLMLVSWFRELPKRLKYLATKWELPDCVGGIEFPWITFRHFSSPTDDLWDFWKKEAITKRLRLRETESEERPWQNGKRRTHYTSILGVLRRSHNLLESANNLVSFGRAAGSFIVVILLCGRHRTIKGKVWMVEFSTFSMLWIRVGDYWELNRGAIAAKVSLMLNIVNLLLIRDNFRTYIWNVGWKKPKISNTDGRSIS